MHRWDADIHFQAPVQLHAHRFLEALELPTSGLLCPQHIQKHVCTCLLLMVFVPEHENTEQMLILIFSSHANNLLCRNRLVYKLTPTKKHC